VRVVVIVGLSRKIYDHLGTLHVSR
jgi:hypothetical protein